MPCSRNRHIVESVLQRVAPMFRGALARAGVFAFVVLGLLPFLRPSSGGEARSISVAQAFPTAAVVSVEIRPERVRDVARPAVVLGEQATPAPTAQPEPTATPAPTRVPPGHSPGGRALAYVLQPPLPPSPGSTRPTPMGEKG